MASSSDHLEQNHRFGAPNYVPLPVVVSRGAGAWVTDVEGRQYLDMLSAYSALNFGHSNPRLVAVLEEQLKRLTLTSRAFYNDQLGPFCEELAAFCEMEMVLPMNTGAEAVETAIKAARKWGYDRRGIPGESARIVCFDGNFHGRTTTIISFSTEAVSRAGFGPYTPGFDLVPFGDAERLEEVLQDETVAVLIEPIQGEAGVIIPPDGYLQNVRKLCDEHGLLLLADEIQTGLCRTGKRFACEHEEVIPDLYILGKSLGGGLVPISAVVGSREVLQCLGPGTHGSTFGGNPLACAIAREVLRLIIEERPEERARELGGHLLCELTGLIGPAVDSVRGRGLLVGVDISESCGTARQYCEKLCAHQVLTKDTRRQTLRLAPPLVIEQQDLDWGLERIKGVLSPGGQVVNRLAGWIKGLFKS